MQWKEVQRILGPVSRGKIKLVANVSRQWIPPPDDSTETTLAKGRKWSSPCELATVFLCFCAGV